MGEQIADKTASRAVIKRALALTASLAYVGGIIERGLAGANPFVVGAAKSTLARHSLSAARGALCYLCDYEYEMRVENPQSRTYWLREVFGNPFRSTDFAPWRTDTAVSLARQMYESRDFSAMPILADAFQDAGCDNADVLDHCRSGAHARGCWVVDGVLGLE